MEIRSYEPIDVIFMNNDHTQVPVKIEVGKTYVYDPYLAKSKIELSRKGRIVEVLGFTDNFMPSGAIVKYKDNNRRGMVNPCKLKPFLA